MKKAGILVPQCPPSLTQVPYMLFQKQLVKKGEVA